MQGAAEHYREEKWETRKTMGMAIRRAKEEIRNKKRENFCRLLNARRRQRPDLDQLGVIEDSEVNIFHKDDDIKRRWVD